MVTFDYLGDIQCGGSIGVDDLHSEWEPLTGTPTYWYYFYFYMEHGDSLDVYCTANVHQPTVDFNDNTTAIYYLEFFGIFLVGTPAGDYGSILTNHGPYRIENTGPSRWIYAAMATTFGACAFQWSLSNCQELGDRSGHVGHTQNVTFITRHGGGGWNAGHA